jgi:hypothetical protein
VPLVLGLKKKGRGDEEEREKRSYRGVRRG